MIIRTLIESKIQNILDYYKKNSFTEFTRECFRRLGLDYFSRSLIFIILNLEDFSEVIKKPYSFHIATTADIQGEQENYFEHEYLFSKREILYRLKKGSRLFVFKDNNKMVFFLWAEQRGATINAWHMPLRLPQNMAYISGGFTMPDYRNRGIASKIKKEIFQYLKEEGFTKLLGVVNPMNLKALNLDKQLGFKEYQIVHYKRYLHLRSYTVAKFNSDDHKEFISLFKSPKDIWKTFL